MRGTASLLVVGTMYLCSMPVLAQEAPRSVGASAISAQQLQRELEAMKEQMRQMQDRIQQQEERLRQLSAQPPPPPVPAPATTVTRDQEQLKQQVKEEVLQALQPELAAANKTFPAQFNPAIGLILDTAFSYSEHEQENFEFRAAELGLSVSIDPFARAYAIFTGSPEGFEVEEAAMVTTALPYNLEVKGGRFFADFGRLSKFHDHDLPFVNRPVVLDSFVGGESQGDGIEVSYLVPIPHYLTVTAGMYNKLGGENERVSNEIPRGIDQFTYLGRAATFFSLSDAHSVDFGLSYAYTPAVAIEADAERHLAGVDLTYRYTPLSQAAYRGLIWGTEVLFNRENRPLDGFPEGPDADPPTAFHQRNAFGLYSYLETRLSRRLAPGFLFEYAQDVDRATGATKAYSPYLTFWLSEFQRLRLQYTYLDAPEARASQFFLQWTSILGSHVHGFRDR